MKTKNELEVLDKINEQISENKNKTQIDRFMSKKNNDFPDIRFKNHENHKFITVTTNDGTSGDSNNRR